MKKRGESSMLTYFIAIFLATLTLIIVANFAIKWFVEDNSEQREVCRLSVLSRATTPESAQGLVPLKCETEKICISENGRVGDCPNQFAGEEVAKGVAAEGSQTEKARTVEQEVANSMFNCWKMMGQGRLDIFGSEGFSPFTFDSDFAKPRCVVCSRIALSEDLCEESGDLAASPPECLKDHLDINDYLNTERPDESIPFTYLELFTDIGVVAPSAGELEGKGYFDVSKEPTNQVAVLFAQTNVARGKLDAFGDAVIGGSALFGTAILSPVGNLLKSPTGLAAGATAVLVGGGVSAYYTSNAQTIAGAYCGDFSSSSEEARKGCSVVRVVEWNARNVRNINMLCEGGIEGRL